MNVSTEYQRIVTLAREQPELCFTSLNQHLTVELLHTAYEHEPKGKACGVDGVTLEDYERELDSNLRSLHARLHAGTYKAPPVKRVYIPKGTGPEKRPLGIPTLEDKILQRAVSYLLTPIYEQDFQRSSYGFRPGRSAHKAIRRIWKDSSRGMQWILDVDIRKYFDTLMHTHLRTFLDHRVRDGVIRRLLDKWLKAGIWEQGQIRYPTEGTPQGGVISPLLSNIYLHYVLDMWFEQDVKPRLKSGSYLVRFADDFVMGFALEEDAQRVYAVLPKRLARYGLSIHPEKTRVVRFTRPPLNPQPGQENPKSESFNFLGFTHYWGRNRTGRWMMIQRKTDRSRLTRTLKRVSQWCSAHRHDTLSEQHLKLTQQLIGHYAYFGIIGNVHWLKVLKQNVERIWYKWLQRRSRRRDLSWTDFHTILQWYPLPDPRRYQEV